MSINESKCHFLMFLLYLPIKSANTGNLSLKLMLEFVIDGKHFLYRLVGDASVLSSIILSGYYY